MNRYNRSADEKIYKENRYDKPKELFKQIAALLGLDKKKNIDSKKKLMDIGCATGEFLYYVRKINPLMGLSGIEYSKNLVDCSKEFLQKNNIKIAVGDANNLKVKDSQYDFVITSGVTSIFDDFRQSFEEMIRIAKNGAWCLNSMLVNEFDIDVIIKYIHPVTKKIESGWNKFSIKSISDFLKNHKNVGSYKFIKHKMPFDLPRGKDLMRSWTVIDKNEKRILWNGLNMEISTYFILFKVKK